MVIARSMGDMAGGFAVDQGHCQDPGLSRVALAQYGFAGNSRTHHYPPALRRIETGTGLTRTACRPTMCSTPLSRPTWKTTSARARSSPRVYAEADVRRVVHLLKISEYKRRQSPVGIRVTQRGFGKDWPATPSPTATAIRTEFDPGCDSSRFSGAFVMKKIEAVIKPFKLDEVREALSEIGGFRPDGHRSQGVRTAEGATPSCIVVRNMSSIFCPR